MRVLAVPCLCVRLGLMTLSVGREACLQGFEELHLQPQDVAYIAGKKEEGSDKSMHDQSALCEQLPCSLFHVCDFCSQTLTKYLEPRFCNVCDAVTSPFQPSYHSHT